MFIRKMRWSPVHPGIYEVEIVPKVGVVVKGQVREPMFIGIVKRTQEWELLSYAMELALGGVSQVKNKPRLPPFIRYGFPQRLLLLAKSKEARRRREMVVEYLARNLHVARKS